MSRSLFNKLITQLAQSGSIEDAANLVELVMARSLLIQELADLTWRLATSGITLATNDLACDAASSGGIASLTTILTPLMLAAEGRAVPKITVPGATAGSFDTLSQIPGYRTLQISELESLPAGTFAQVIAGDSVAPLDALLFEVRSRQTAAKKNADLMIASILCKKVAAGLKRVLIEIRSGPGTNLEQANSTAFAEKLCEVGRQVNLDVIAVVLASSLPAMPYVGRGESLLALEDVLGDIPTNQMREHKGYCAHLAALCLNHSPASSSLDMALDTHLQFHGTNISSFRNHVAALRRQPTTCIEAKTSGFASCDLRALRQIVKDLNPPVVESEYPDRSGVTLLVSLGSFVSRGEPLLRIRSTDLSDAQRSRLESTVSVVPIISHHSRVEVLHA